MLVSVSIKDCGGQEVLINGGAACQEEKITGIAILRYIVLGTDVVDLDL